MALAILFCSGKFLFFGSEYTNVRKHCKIWYHLPSWKPLSLDNSYPGVLFPDSVTQLLFRWMNIFTVLWHSYDLRNPIQGVTSIEFSGTHLGIEMFKILLCFYDQKCLPTAFSRKMFLSVCCPGPDMNLTVSNSQRETKGQGILSLFSSLKEFSRQGTPTHPHRDILIFCWMKPQHVQIY